MENLHKNLMGKTLGLLKFFLLTFALALFTSVFLVSPIYAVTKTSGNLEVTLDEPLFPSTAIWYPGLSETKSITVKNKGSGTEKVAIEALNESETGGLASVLEFKVTEGGVERYNSAKTLRDFFDDGIVQLSDLGGGGSTTYDFTVTFKSTAGNEYQAKEAKFDLKIGFWQEAAAPGEEGVISPAVIVTGAGAAVCTATAPPAPTLLSVTPAGAGSVALAWTAVSPVTHYLIAYGLSSGSYIYGNPNVGDVTSFTVSGLSGGTTYYFVVAGVNDCAPGPYSNELSSGAVLGVWLPGPAVGFVPLEEIKGITTEGKIPEIAGIATPSAEFEGRPVCFWWWVILLIETILLLLYYWSIREKEKRFWYACPLALGFIAYLVHEYAHRFYLPSRFCPWFWLLDIIVLILTALFYDRIHSRE